MTFYIDGSLVATHAQAISGQMRPAFSDLTAGGGALLLESLRVGPYAATGTFTSRVLDAGSPTDWTAIVSTAEIPAGATLSLSARFGDTSVPDVTWTSFIAIAPGTAAMSSTSRYAHNRAVLSGTGSQTPVLEAITFSGTGVPPTPTLAVTDVSIAEGSSGIGYATFTVTLSAATSREVSVSYATADGTAAAGVDYTAVSGTLVFPAGSTVRTLLVPIVADTTIESQETFQLTLSGPVNATLADSQGIGTIVNDDFPSLSIGDVSVTEGDSATANAVFTVSLSTPGYEDVTVAFATSNGTAVSPQDYTSTSGTLTFPAGTTTRQISVPVAGDLRNEVAETFTVTLSAATKATIGTAAATGTIIDNDPIPSLTINDVTVTEPDTGSVTATFTLTLSAASGQAVTVAYATADGTATSPADYTATSGPLRSPRAKRRRRLPSRLPAIRWMSLQKRSM